MTLNLSCFVIILLLSIASDNLAQAPDNKRAAWITMDSLAYRKAFKLNSNDIRVFNPGRNLNVFPSLQVATKKHFIHELEFNGLGRKETRVFIYAANGDIAGHRKNERSYIRLRYQWIVPIVKHGRFIPQIGLSFLNYYEVTHSHPEISNINDVSPSALTDRKTNRWYQVAGLTPQLRYQITKRFFADMVLPVNIIEWGYGISRVENKYLSQKQSGGGFEVDFQRYYLQVKIGFGFKFR